MKYFLSILGVAAAAILLFVSAAMNWRFGFSLGKTEIDAQIYGAASAAADGLKALLPFFVIWALRQRNYAQMLSGALLWIVCAAYSLTSSLGFAALNRADTMGTREAEVQVYKELRAELNRAKEKLSWVPQHRSIGEVQADLTALLAQPVRKGRRGKILGTVSGVSENCSAANWRTQKQCDQVLNLRKDLAVAQQALKLEREIEQLQAKIAAVSAKSKGFAVANNVDPQATLLAKLTGFDLSSVQIGLVILVALLVELGSGLGLFVAFSHMKFSAKRPQVIYEPASITVAKRPVRRLLLPRSDVERYFASKVELSDGASVTSRALYSDYCLWCEQHSRTAMALTVFGRQFSELGIQKAKIAGRIRYIGIKLKNTPQDDMRDIREHDAAKSDKEQEDAA